MPELSDFKVGDVWRTRGDGTLWLIVGTDCPGPYPVTARVAGHKDSSSFDPTGRAFSWQDGPDDIVERVLPSIDAILQVIGRADTAEVNGFLHANVAEAELQESRLVHGARVVARVRTSYREGQRDE